MSEMRICRDCSAEYPNRKGGPLRCEPCREQKAREHALRPRPERRVRGIRKLVCRDCSQSFAALRSDTLRCDNCNRKHRLEWQRSYERLAKYNTCPQCGDRKSKVASKCKTCDGNQKSIEQRGANNPSWKGGKTRHSAGYIQVRAASNRNNSPYQMEHILVWEAANGPVPDGYQIHHKNGIKDDNRLENLEAETESDHHSNKHHKVLKARICELEARLANYESQIPHVSGEKTRAPRHMA